MFKYDNYFLPVDDLDVSKQFCRDIGLSLKFEFADSGMAAFRVGDEEPAIILKDKNRFPHAKPAVWFTVPDVMLEYRKLRAKNVRFLSEPFRIRTGLAVEFEDPSGNRLGLTDYTGR